MNIIVSFGIAACLTCAGIAVATPQALPGTGAHHGAAVAFTAPSGQAVVHKKGSGLHEVSLAIDSVPKLTASEREGLKKVAGTILAQYGPLPLAKRRVVFRQTQRYLMGLAGQTSGGGKEGERLLLETFANDFGQYVRLPAVTAQQRSAAAAMFQNAYAAVSKLISHTFTDTPPAIRRRLITETGYDLENIFRDACNYYQPAMLYPSRHAPSVRDLYNSLVDDPFASSNQKAFSNTAAMLNAKGVTRKSKNVLVQQFISSQASEEALSAQSALMKGYFNGWQWRALPSGVYGMMPASLEQQWKVFESRQNARWQKRYKEETDPAVNGGLYPTGSQILAGSGVKE
jgi:hypothetical protein